MPSLMRPGHWVMDRSELVQPALPEGPITREQLRDAARFAIRAATNNGTLLDFDPDALVIDLENALFGSGPVCLEVSECQQ